MSESDILACHFLTQNGVETGFQLVSTLLLNSVYREPVYTLFLHSVETGFHLVSTLFNRNGMPVSGMPFPNLTLFLHSVETS